MLIRKYSLCVLISFLFVIKNSYSANLTGGFKPGFPLQRRMLLIEGNFSRAEKVAKELQLYDLLKNDYFSPIEIQLSKYKKYSDNGDFNKEVSEQGLVALAKRIKSLATFIDENKPKSQNELNNDLLVSIRNQDESKIRFIVNRGNNINSVINYKYYGDITPLQYAISIGSPEIVYLLLMLGADPYLKASNQDAFAFLQDQINSAKQEIELQKKNSRIGINGVSRYLPQFLEIEKSLGNYKEKEKNNVMQGPPGGAPF